MTSSEAATKHPVPPVGAGGLSRRAAVAALLSLPATFGMPRAPQARAQGGQTMPTVERTATRVAGFKSSEMDFQLMRSLGAANYGGGTPGEIFHARNAIQGDDPQSWCTAFAAVADHVRASGEAALKRGHGVSARDHFLRASMYYRAAEYFADPFGQDGHAWGLASGAAFIEAAKHIADRIERVAIPFEGRNLPGYFMTPAAGARGGRTLLVLTGFDGTGEELYFEAGRAGLERGFNVFVAEGPGQVGAMRLHADLTFRPDFEKPVAAMLDFALARPDVAAEKLALYGISFGGYFALRAGVHDRRIRALVLNSPIVDLHAYMTAFMGRELVANAPPLKLSDLDSIPDTEMPKLAKHGFKGSCRRFGVDSFQAWLRRLQDFTAVDRLAEVRCPTLAMVGAGEGEEATAQFERYRQNVSGPVTHRVFTVAEGADMHCQMGNLPLSCAAVFDWLDEVFGA